MNDNKAVAAAVAVGVVMAFLVAWLLVRVIGA